MSTMKTRVGTTRAKESAALNGQPDVAMVTVGAIPDEEK